MAAIRHTLQKDLFRPNDEALYAVVNVAKQGTGKKKKTSFLCLAVTKEKPFQVRLYKVQKSDKEVYKKKQSWPLSELRNVDGKHDILDSPEFDLTFDKNYKWVASRVGDKKEFIETLWMLSEKYLTSRKPSFKNVPPELMDIDLSGRLRSGTARSQQSGQEVAETTGDDYTNLTQKEERDMEKMLAQFSDALTNVELFTDQLSKELQELEYQNITALMGSATQAKELQHLIDMGLDELDILDDRLSTYEKLLQRVRDQMGVMEYDDNRFEIERANNKKLLEEVKHIVVTLDIPKRYIRLLKEGDLYHSVGIAEVVSAAKVLLDAVQTPFSPGIRELKAVNEQYDNIDKLKSEFASRFYTHLDKFISQHSIPSTLRANAGELTLSPHDTTHIDFEPYTELMGWMKELEEGKYTEIKKHYADSFSKIYEKEIHDFLEMAKLKCTTKSKGPKGSVSVHSLNSQEVRNSPLPVPRKRDKGTLLRRSPSKESINSTNSIESGQSVDSMLPIDRFGRFERIFDVILSELEPYIMAEQDFCVSFFNLKMPVEDNEQVTRQDSGLSETDGASISRSKPPLKQPNEVKDMMNILFPTLSQEMLNFLGFGEKLDSHYTMYMIVRMSNQGAHVMSSQTTGTPATFLGTMFGNWLVAAKRMFDRFITALCQQIEETRINKKHRCGVLPFVTKFEEFTRIAEAIFSKSERRSDIDKAYLKLVQCIYKNIERIATEHEKTPQEVVLLENYHAMFGYITGLRNHSLEQEKREAKQKYNTAVEQYITNRLGKPMEKLSIFFEGVAACIKSGVKAEDIGYQIAYNQQELKNIIREYPAKEVKKGLEQLFKKVDKHVSVEGLKQVVWHNMQEEFVQQYKDIQDLIGKCYPGSQIHMLVTVNEILEFFSNIAQLH